MANEITVSSTSTDQEKMLSAKLLERSYLKLVAGSLCEKVTMKQGTGLTAYFVRYKRMSVPLATITEGTDPSNSSFTLEEVTVVLDQWGDVVTITDQAQLTTSHPLVQQVLDLLADNAARVMDREIQLVWLAGTNVQYGDGTVTTRRTVTSAMKISDVIIHKARITLVNAGAPPRGGPSGDAKQVQATGNVTQGSSYVAVCGPEVMADIMSTSTSMGTFVAAAQYNNVKALYNAEIGTWLNFRWVETNFIPRFTLLGDTTVANASASDFGTNTPVVTAVNGGGTLNSGNTYFYKVTRKDLLRGFEEAISIAHSTAADATGGDDDSFTFNFSSLTAGYVYNLYFDTVVDGGTGTDATLGLVTANIAIGTTVTVTTEATGATAPDNVDPTTSPTIHPVFVFGESAVSWVGFYGIQTKITKDESIIGNVLQLKRAMGYKFFGKAMIRDQTRMLRMEVASSY